ncbi:MAG: hypothetical protein GY705_27760 [Bacteroidetes bacterium]|nr:hypothetical protein [Bacteroidota bacterium]
MTKRGSNEKCKQLKVSISLGSKEIDVWKLVSDKRKIYFKYYPGFIKTGFQMDDFMVENGWIENGLHHEIYLSDPEKTVAEKMKTILFLFA